MKRLITLFIFIFATQLIGGIGSLFTIPNINTWYITLNQPSFSPPNFIFAPVWTLLYTLLGVSAWLIYQKAIKNKAAKKAMLVFALNLFLNLVWSFLFFFLHKPMLAFVEIIILLIVIVYNSILFYRISKPAGLLFIPYILWVSFASILNLSLAILN